MRRIILFSILALPISCICFAQSDQSESLTITTYYPSPLGVYKTLRLNPTSQPLAGSAVIQPGTMYFDKDDQKMHIYNGISNEWVKLGSGSSLGSSITVIDSGHKEWPDICPKGTIIYKTIAGGHGTASLCPVAWLKKIEFKQTFKKPPQVFVAAQTLSGSDDSNMDDYYTCGEHSNDALQAFPDPDSITTKGFDLRIGSSANRGSGCCLTPACVGAVDREVLEYFGKGEASWIAFGE